jgi:L-asparagine oxygenase
METYTFTNQERNLLSSKYETIPFSPYSHFLEFENAAIEITRRLLPKSLYNLLRDLRNGKNHNGALLLMNIPRDKNLIRTPESTNFDYKDKGTFVSEAFSVGIGSVLGEVYAYKNEKGGNKIHNNFLTQKGQNSVSNEGKLLIPYHIEDVHAAPYHPDYVILNCLRGHKDANTYLINSSDIIKLLTQDQLIQLYKAEYFTTPPQSFGGDADGNGNLMPILSGTKEKPILFVEFTDTKGITHKANKCLEEFKRICVEEVASIEVNLSSGNLLLFDNRINLHSRNAYNEDVTSQTKRWLQRLFVKDGGLLEWSDQMLDSYNKILKY